MDYDYLLTILSLQPSNTIRVPVLLGDIAQQGSILEL